MKHVLTIAGTDPSGAAGIQVDLQVFRDFGVYGLSCITAVLAQNTSGVDDWVAIEPSLVSKQLSAVLDDIRVDAVKIGMTPTASVVEAIAESLYGRNLPIVLDPVLASGDGSTALVRDGTTEALTERLFPIATLVTPNATEAAILLGRPFDPTEPVSKLATELAERGFGNVLVKGGHADTERVTDHLVVDGELTELEAFRRIPDDVRGTGCQLSSAIAAGLARGTDLPRAVRDARTYLNDLLESSRGPIGKGRLVIKRQGIR